MAARLRVAASRDHLTRDGEPWFYLADTIWCAFSDVPLDEWEDYLHLRRRQGFNALQISVLPILHDASGDGGHLGEPFEGFWSGEPQFGRLTPAYVERARTMLDAARRYGFTPALVDLWCNYVPDTWASRMDPRYVMPDEAVPDYLASVVDAFEEYEPIHIVSGDGDFATRASTDAYARALRILRGLAPEALTALHSQPEARIPDELCDMPELDLYVYQSGHHLETQFLTHELATHYRARAVQRPVINIEPCYEGHGHGFAYGRFDAGDVRRAIWESIVSGASAGVAYGAHGVWGWHHRGASFNHADFSGTPFDRTTALAFDGAWDAAFARRIIDDRRLHGLAPRQDLLVGAPDDVRAAVSAGGDLVVYVPASIDIVLAAEPGSRVERWDLGRRRQEDVHIPDHAEGLRIPMHEWPGDALLVIHGGR